MKRYLAAIGVGFLAGVVVYAIWTKTQKEKEARQKVQATPTEDRTDFVTSPSEAETTVEFVAQNAAATITNRHEEATQIMKDAVEIICQRSAVSEDEADELDQISDELDALFKED